MATELGFSWAEMGLRQCCSLALDRQLWYPNLGLVLEVPRADTVLTSDPISFRNPKLQPYGKTHVRVLFEGVIF